MEQNFNSNSVTHGVFGEISQVIHKAEVVSRIFSERGQKNLFFALTTDKPNGFKRPSMVSAVITRRRETVLRYSLMIRFQVCLLN